MPWRERTWSPPARRSRLTGTTRKVIERNQATNPDDTKLPTEHDVDYSSKYDLWKVLLLDLTRHDAPPTPQFAVYYLSARRMPYLVIPPNLDFSPPMFSKSRVAKTARKLGLHPRQDSACNLKCDETHSNLPPNRHTRPFIQNSNNTKRLNLKCASGSALPHTKSAR